MNSRQRYEAMLRNEPVDFLPRTPILMQFVSEYIESPYGAFCSDYRVKVEGNVRCAEDFDFDLVGVMSDPYTETQAFGAEIIFHDAQTPECAHPPLESTRDFSSLPTPDPQTATRMANTLQTLRQYREQLGDSYPVLGWVEGPAAEAADLRGITQFMMDIIDDPGWSGELMDLCVDVAIDFAQAQVEAGADTIGVGDAIASQVSPSIYEKQILPREVRLLSAIGEMGAKARLHICGNITHLLPGIATLPLDIIDVDHMVDLVKVRDMLSGDVVLSGNLDPVTEILQGTPEKIRQRTLDIYRQVGNPFVVNAGCEIPPGTPHENLRALCEPIAYQG
jgi:MtaA/CmuA family methyltransferase